MAVELPETVAAIIERLHPIERSAPRHVFIKPCVCGGQVRADVLFPADGVRSHQRTKLHQAWRARVE